MEWSASARSVWGKLDPKACTSLSLVTHLEHAAAMASRLWKSFFPRSLRFLLMADLAASDAEACAIYCWFAGTHDVGKVSVVFAQQAEAVGMAFVLDRMRDAGLATTRIPRDENIRHEVVSQLAIRDWLALRCGFDRSAANTWSCVAGGHHGKNPTMLDAMAAGRRPHALGTGAWQDVRFEILDAMAHETGALPLLTARGTMRLPVRAQALLTSMVIVADWLASNQESVPYLDDLTPSERVDVAYSSLVMPGPWDPPPAPVYADAHLHARFPDLAAATARPIQAALLDAARTSVEPPLLILEAAMGGGKTEAALLAAEVLAARFGQGGIYFGLPTMATANPMFARTLSWLDAALTHQDASAALAHGKAGLNDTYAALLEESWRGQVYDEDEPSAGRPLVNGWLRGRRRAGLANFVVGTIDQGLFTALKAKYVALRHLGLAGKVVIVDEVHAADLYMREYLKRALTWLGAYGTPVILMSATLPPEQRDEYLTAYARGRGVRTPLTSDRDDQYPRITRYDGTLARAEVLDSTAPTSLRIERLADDPDELRALLRTLLESGGCAGIICNTVSRAQETYRSLTDEFGRDVVLLHSRFIAPDRARREQELVDHLGRSATNRPDRLIVVGTQVLEQSLDVDFDVMITDLAPIDLVLQRAGRLHRHAGRRRPGPLTEPTLYLRGVTDWGTEPPAPVRGSRTVYGTAPLLRAAAVLKGHANITLPAAIPALVRRAYDGNLRPPPGWEAAWAAAERVSDRADAAAWTRAQSYLLGEPNLMSDLTGWLDVQTPDPERSEEQGRSQVRDSEDSLEVITLWRDADGNLHLPAVAPRHAGAIVPEGQQWGMGSEHSIARAMATCTLSLPVQLTNPGVIDTVIRDLERSVDYSGWQESPWLRGQLVLTFDETNQTHVAGYALRYSPEEGLIVTHPEGNP